MFWKNSLFIVFLIVVSSCKNESSKEEINLITSEEKENSYLIEAEELLRIHTQEGIKIIDFRKEKNYDEGHIKGALQMWRRDIEDKSYPFGGMLASSETIENLFSSLGIKNEDTVIVYDDRGSCDAIRFWWVMQYYHFNSVKILNGGIDAWKTLQGKITSEKTETQLSKFVLGKEINSSIISTKEDVLSKLGDNSNVKIIDTRTLVEYSGKRHKKGAAKGGRIPKSTLFDWDNAIDYSNDKKLKTTKDLKALVSSLNIKETDTIITYCHSGVRSAHTFFVLKELLGYQQVSNYDGSWTEWSYLKELPYKKDSITEIID